MSWQDISRTGDEPDFSEGNMMRGYNSLINETMSAPTQPPLSSFVSVLVATTFEQTRTNLHQFSKEGRINSYVTSAPRPPVQETGNQSSSVATAPRQAEYIPPFSEQNRIRSCVGTETQPLRLPIQETGYGSTYSFLVVTGRNIPQLSEDYRITSYGTVSGFNNNIPIPEPNLPGPSNMIGDSQRYATCSFQ